MDDNLLQYPYTGLGVTIDCKAANGKFNTRGVGKLDEEGKFKVSLTDQEILEDGKLKEECFARLHSASAAPCPSHNGLESSKIIFKSKTDGKHTFTPVGKLKFSPITCTSAFLWPHFNYPPSYKPHPWKKPFPKPKPPAHKPPPIPVYKPKPKPPVHKPPLVPVYKPKSKPPVYIPPPTPIYKSKPPVYISPPASVYKSKLPVYMPLPALIYKPKSPVYMPPPAPVYKPKSPVYKPPTVQRRPKPPAPPPPVANKGPRQKPVLTPPPPPVYKPKPPVYMHPPIPIYKPIPPIHKKPCPPIPKIPPKNFHHHHPIFGGWPPLPPHFPHH